VEEKVLQTLRHDEAKRVDRGELVEGRAFFCWDDAKKEGYFPLVCKEDVQPRVLKIKVMCLTPARDAPGVPGTHPLG